MRLPVKDKVQVLSDAQQAALKERQLRELLPVTLCALRAGQHPLHYDKVAAAAPSFMTSHGYIPQSAKPHIQRWIP